MKSEVISHKYQEGDKAVTALFADAIRAAHRSTILRHKTGAAIYDAKGNLVSVGWSHVPEMTFKKTPFSMHAEHHACRRAGHVMDAHSIIIVTIARKSGNITSGAPCSVCLDMLVQQGFKEIHYSEAYNG
jgi:deoxycytidylate deaminase